MNEQVHNNHCPLNIINQLVDSKQLNDFGHYMLYFDPKFLLVYISQEFIRNCTLGIQRFISKENFHKEKKNKNVSQRKLFDLKFIDYVETNLIN